MKSSVQNKYLRCLREFAVRIGSYSDFQLDICCFWGGGEGAKRWVPPPRPPSRTLKRLVLEREIES